MLTGVRDQVPYATSRALNRLAILTQKDGIERVFPAHQRIRTGWLRPGMEKGLNAAFASKSNLQAVVGTRAAWEGLQETGGDKRTRSGGDLAIPSQFWKPVQSIMEKGKKPRSILDVSSNVQKSADRATLKAAQLNSANKARGFWVTFRAQQQATRATRLAAKKQSIAQAFAGLAGRPFLFRGAGMRPGIYARVGDGRRLTLLFGLRSSARIEPRLNFVREETALVQAQYDKVFGEELAQAIRTARTIAWIAGASAVVSILWVVGTWAFEHFKK